VAVAAGEPCIVRGNGCGKAIDVARIDRVQMLFERFKQARRLGIDECFSYFF
jgi:hypothetical protein